LAVVDERARDPRGLQIDLVRGLLVVEAIALAGKPDAVQAGRQIDVSRGR